MQKVVAIYSSLIVAFVNCGGCSNSMSQAESAAREALRSMGAIAILDTQQVHVATLMMTAPEIVNKMDEAIPHVADLPYLTHLELTNANLDDEHMQTIGSLKRLTSLVLSGTQVGDEGFKHVARLKLHTLYVDGTNITSSSLERIGDMASIEILDISSLNVTSDLTPLKKLKKLEWLVLDNSSLDSAAVDVIGSLPSLGRLTIKGATISDSDFATLRSAKPSLSIDRDEPAAEAEASTGATATSDE